MFINFKMLLFINHKEMEKLQNILKAFIYSLIIFYKYMFSEYIYLLIYFISKLYNFSIILYILL